MIAYRLFADETLILDTRNGINDGILSAKFKVEVNKPSSMEFSMAATHPLINTIKRMSMAIILEMMYIDNNDVVQDDYIPFIGRVTTINEDMYSNKTFTCEGGSAFDKDCLALNDFERKIRSGNYLTVKSVIIWCYNNGYVDAGYVETIGIVHQLYTLSHELDGSSVPWTIETPIQKPAPEHKEDEEEETENYSYSYETIENMMNSSVVSPYGGINYYYYDCKKYRESTGEIDIQSGISLTDFTIYNIYFTDIFYGFRYEKGSLVHIRPKEDYSDVVPTYGDDIPSFGLDDNIIDIKPSYLKTDIWTGIFPVGKDGLNIEGNYNSSATASNTIWQSTLVQKYGRIMKQVNFSEVDNVQALVSFANNYLARFASQDYFAMQTYEINGIEPCEVFEPTEFLIKLGYQVVLSIGGDLVVFPCLSLEHDLFDIQQSRYVVGPLIPDMILNEDFTAVYH